ncbi:cuticle protein 10.9-like [Uloborus diversus]|uniref:cuticle protein 10.9-like n=1 Tax=Uloborus diversus TaxID=327109 RepID=UPI00240A0806|nr:cuticle protein 10.9-like [Uloborus diversus]
MIQQVSVLLPAIAVCLAIVQAYPELSGNSASPYSFGYASSESARQESSDASGKVTGSYRVTNEDGSVRVVNYVADDQGFRAEVETDEAGTTDDQPADVVVRSTAASPKRFDGSMVERQMEQFTFIIQNPFRVVIQIN